jgi:hypothetical protein
MIRKPEKAIAISDRTETNGIRLPGLLWLA